ncbi:MAG: argininosuccinate lyase [Candidatus Nanohaloarchaeota archaeon QJJ-9]|nr:argininosuccinate lyase [Candidatus Nanohaloarchaeota archaeon QJJ-9]
MVLWETESTETEGTVLDFTKEEEGLEKELLPYDILGNIAHAKMLQEQDFLSLEEFEEIKDVLKDIYEERPEVNAEDVHTFVEEEVTAETPAGKKLHTGRSRNDQVVLDTRLFMKEAAIETALSTLELMKSLENFAEEKNKLVPGYTHQQQAMPSSTGLWASSFVDTLADDLRHLKAIYRLLDQNPLGAAASYGTELDVDRLRTKELLGFESVQENPIYCCNRGKHELMLLQSLSNIVLDVQKLAEDLINFSEDQEIFDIPEEFCTGSSIMPQKSNPDVLELTRAKASEVVNHASAVSSIIQKLPSGYNRDTQQTKKHLFEALRTTKEVLAILTKLIGGLEVSDDFDVKEEIYAAYTANQLVEEDVSFREAYGTVKEEKEYEKREGIKEPKNQEWHDLASYWENELEEWEEMEERLLDL